MQPFLIYTNFLFFSFRGRIGRRDFWIGTVIIIALSLVGTFLIQPDYWTYNEAAEDFAETSLGVRIFDVLLLIPTLAVTIKRLNDRDWPAWVFWVAAVAFVLVTFSDWFGVQYESPLSIFALIVFVVFLLWLLIDQGFLKGTVGPNRHGEDPLTC